MRDLSHSTLQLLSGGLRAETMSLAVVSAIAGYRAGRYAAPPSGNATSAGTSWIALSCGMATHALWTNEEFSPTTQPAIGTAANILCGAVMAIGQNVMKQIAIANPDYLENVWLDC